MTASAICISGVTSCTLATLRTECAYIGGSANETR
jgi:hypothetical protein